TRWRSSVHSIKKRGRSPPLASVPAGRARHDPARPTLVAARKIARSARACQGSFRSPRLRAMDQEISAVPPDAAVFRGSGLTRRIEVPVLAAVPGLVHLFTARGSDTRAAIAEAAGRDMPLRTLRQVHGAVVRVTGPTRPSGDDGASDREEGDALIVDGPGVAAGVWVADCLPILICDGTTRTVAAVHAGWRGTVAGVVGRAIDALRR